MARADMDRLGLAEADMVTAHTPGKDGVERHVDGLRVAEYDIPAA